MSLETRTLDMMNSLAGALEKIFNPEVQAFFWVLLVGPFGDEGRNANCISNGERADIIEFLRETADRLESKQDQN